MYLFQIIAVSLIVLFIGFRAQTTESPLPLYRRFGGVPTIWPTQNSSYLYNTIKMGLTNVGEAPIPLPAGLETVDWMYPCYNRSIENSENWVVFWMKGAQMYCETFSNMPTLSSTYAGRTMLFTLSQMVRVEFSMDRCKYQKSYEEYLKTAATTKKP